MKQKNIFIIIFLFCFFALIKKPVKAVDISLYQVPSNIGLEPFTLIATISGAKTGTNYLRIDLFKGGTTSYFGETFNGYSWYSGSNYQEYLPATISAGLWSGEIIGRVNKNDIETGLYKIRLRRYTSSNNYDYSLSYDIYIALLTPTPIVDLVLTNTGFFSSDSSFSGEFSYPTGTPILIPVSYENIYLSEVYPNPSRGESEWVEIYNNNDFPVDLINWYLDDIEDGGSSLKKFSLNLAAKSYEIIELSSAMFNNDGDSVRLLDLNKNLKDSFEYSSSQSGKSYGRTSFETDEFCLQEPSKGKNNNSCITTIAKIATTFPSVIPTILSPAVNLSKISITEKPSFKQTLMIVDKGKNNLIFNNNQSQEKVLGAKSQRVKKNNVLKNLINSLSFLSFSYAILGGLGIILKMR